MRLRLRRLGLPRTVVILAVVSALNDAASEMITPLLPLFLTLALGAGPAVVGLVEGLAEAVAGVLKSLSGRLADRGWNSKRLVLGGYGISNAARPLIGLALGWSWVLALRAFGFHRALDHAGAMLGPLAAFALHEAGVPLGRVFYWSVIPGCSAPCGSVSARARRFSPRRC